MKKISAIGFNLVVVGAIVRFYFDSDGIDFITGFLLGAGIALIVVGLIKKKV
ncbi:MULTISPECIES: hypothetical protein [Bizionia]|uniref:hypothetical protein n=1 Tax=Bizionia TaxID=283785 RepID=UPI001478B8B7|nr:MULTISPECIES: hypothetical protein [Bizionia]